MMSAKFGFADSSIEAEWNGPKEQTSNHFAGTTAEALTNAAEFYGVRTHERRCEETGFIDGGEG
jgi:hypothetical protein